jgi:hypothetical protein
MGIGEGKGDHWFPNSGLGIPIGKLEFGHQLT